jgi:hypothetical protein
MQVDQRQATRHLRMFMKRIRGRQIASGGGPGWRLGGPGGFLAISYTIETELNEECPLHHHKNNFRSLSYTRHVTEKHCAFPARPIVCAGSGWSHSPLNNARDQFAPTAVTWVQYPIGSALGAPFQWWWRLRGDRSWSRLLLFRNRYFGPPCLKAGGKK